MEGETATSKGKKKKEGKKFFFSLLWRNEFFFFLNGRNVIFEAIRFSSRSTCLGFNLHGFIPTLPVERRA